MTKAIKITQDSKIIIVDNWETDPDYVNNVISGYALTLPQFWAYHTFKLTVFIVDIYDERHEINNIATNIFRKLYNPYGQVDQVIKGFMFICNEDDERPIDFTLDDYHYLLLKLRDIKYLTRKTDTNRDNWLNSWQDTREHKTIIE